MATRPLQKLSEAIDNMRELCSSNTLTDILHYKLDSYSDESQRYSEIV